MLPSKLTLTMFPNPERLALIVTTPVPLSPVDVTVTPVPATIWLTPESTDVY